MPIPAAVQTFADRRADAAPERYDDLRAVIFNGTLKRSPEPSRTDGLLAVPRGILARVGVRVDEVRTADHEIPPGVWPDMTGHGYPRDDFPAIYRGLVAPADIVILAGPVWLGDQSSLTRKIIERLYAYSGEAGAARKVGGVVTTGDADGGRHVRAQVLHALEQIGLAVPQQSDAYGVGEAERGPSYPDAGLGLSHDRTTRNSVLMTWSLLHLARARTRSGARPGHVYAL